MEFYLGIDTSCYTTSLAVTDGEGNLLSEARKILSVPEGGRGLAQNEAVFQHINNLPELMAEAVRGVPPGGLCCVAASTRPRPTEGSYMPVFRVAESYGKSLAALLKIPFVSASHQEGHLMAGIWSAGGPEEEEFLAVHLSGGTTELLKVRRLKKGTEENFPDGCGQPTFRIELMGGTNDLHAGQFIDRVGVAMGLPFPAGPQLEKLAMAAKSDLSIPSWVKGYQVSFSGPEAAALRMVQGKVSPVEVARAVEKCIANTLEKLLSRAAEETGINSILVVGGVSANRFLRERLTERLQKGRWVRGGTVRLYFATPALSCDNAVGVALIGRVKARASDKSIP